MGNKYNQDAIRNRFKIFHTHWACLPIERQYKLMTMIENLAIGEEDGNN